MWKLHWGERCWPLLNIGLTFLAETLEAPGQSVHRRLVNSSAGGREAPSCPGDTLQGLVHTLHRKPAQVEGSAKSCQNLAGAFDRSQKDVTAGYQGLCYGVAQVGAREGGQPVAT